ncbi:MAG: hypothetical protein PVSMB7_16880 [Chloroflexota bacterium]
MAYRGQTIHNPVTGEHITFLKPAADTHGALLVFECRAEAGMIPLRPHVHTTQSEHFTVISGTLGVMVGGKKYALETGESVLLPARVRHQWWNAGDNDVLFRVEVVPPRNLEATLEAVCGMALDGKLNKKAMPRNPFLMAHLGKFSETYLPWVPISLQNLMLAAGSTIGALFGYDPTFSQYRTLAAGAGTLVQVDVA